MSVKRPVATARAHDGSRMGGGAGCASVGANGMGGPMENCPILAAEIWVFGCISVRLDGHDHLVGRPAGHVEGEGFFDTVEGCS